MRKVTVVLDTASVRRFGPKGFFDAIDRIEGRQLIRFDPKEGVKVALVDIIMKPGHSLDELPWPKNAKVVDVLRREGDRYTCIIKAVAEGRMRKLFALFDFDIIVVPPVLVDRENIVVAFMSDDERLRRYVAVIKMLGVVKEVRVSEFAPPEQGALSALTERQREVVTTAKRLGYYDVPRRASTKDVAKELGISKATAVEHIRKAELRLIENVLAGQ